MHQLLRLTAEPLTQRAIGETLFEVHGYLEDRIVQTVALGPTRGLSRDMEIAPITDGELIREDLLGLVVDGVGRIMIGKDDRPSEGRSIFTHSRRRGHHQKPGRARALDPTQTFSTHLHAIDIFSPIIKGSKVGILGGAGVGKTVLLTAITQAFLEEEEDGIAVFAGVGERIREAHELFSKFRGQFKQERDRSIFVFGQMDRNAGERFRAAHTAVEIAERYRDEGKQVLLFMDNLFRFVQAGAEISTMLGRMPSVLGYQPTLELELGELQERLNSFDNSSGSITSIQCVYIPADDLTDPAINAISRHLATTIVLDRDLMPLSNNAAKPGDTVRRYPAIDLLRSKTRIGGTQGAELADDLRRIFQEKQKLGTKIKYNLASEAEKRFFKQAKAIETLFNQHYREPEALRDRKASEKDERSQIELLRGEALRLLEAMKSEAN